MTTPVRTPGKYGRRAPKNAPALKLGPLLTGIIPAHPAAADYLAKLGGGWQMLGNDVAEKVREAAPALEKIASVVTQMAKADPGLSPEIVADVEEAATVVARIAAELAAAGM